EGLGGAGLLSQFKLGAIVAAQLRVRDRGIGALVCFRSASGRPFDADQVDLCEGIARQLALAIEGAELYRTQQEEAAVSRGLARIGQEMISSLAAPVLLDRLCELTANVLDCDFSHTWVLDPETETFLPASGYGDTAEQWESMRSLRIPRAVIGGMLERF